MGVAPTIDGPSIVLTSEDAVAAIQTVDEELRPRWAVWSNETAATLVRSGVRLATCWDIAAVHRLIHGGWQADPARSWASTHDLAVSGIPIDRPPDLFSSNDDGGPGTRIRSDPR